VFNSESVTTGNLGGLTLTCPADHPYVLGGGGDWNAHNPNGGPYISGDFPDTNAFPNDWYVVGDNPSGSGINPDTLFGWALCSQ
jgi:hypothetical protein